MSFRDNLQHLRAERNMTQEQLAMLLGVSRQSVTKWEAERATPELDKLLKMCQIFDCTLDDLVRGDLTSRSDPRTSETLSDNAAQHRAVPQVPSGPPQDICGYDEHQRSLARRVSTGVSFILVGVALLLLVGGDDGSMWAPGIPTYAVGMFLLFAALLVGLAFLIPAGMDHAAFVRAHPFVEDFYTDEDRLRARRDFTRGLIGGIASIFIGVLGILLLEDTPMEDTYGAAWIVVWIAVGAHLIIRFGMLLGRINVAEYNRSAAEDLEIEDIVNAQIDEARRTELLEQKRLGGRIGAVCSVIMMAATAIGLLLLFVPLGSSGAWRGGDFNPEGTTAMWFWVVWPIGGVLCGMAALLMRAFAHRE